MANLAIFAGIRKDISLMEDNERDVLTQMLLLMDKYDLYGKMAIPKRHDFEHEVPELYRIAAEKKGVFVNSALTEPFGITLLEASASGLPVVSTNDGGPRDIIHNCRSGILVDPTQTKEIARGVTEIITHNHQWETFSKNGIMNTRKHYTWQSHARKYIAEFKLLEKSRSAATPAAVPYDSIGKRLIKLKYFIVCDIDNTLIGGRNEGLPKLIRLLKDCQAFIGFGVATGRTLDAAADILKEHGVPSPDVVISAVGSEIYYGPAGHYGQGWDTHISNRWDRNKIVGLLKKFDFLEYQPEAVQRKFKISYDMAPDKEHLAMIHARLLKHKCRYNLIYSHQQHLDILPYRASKGKALRYLSYKWEIPLANFLVCGDSGNDEEMLRGETRAAVVGNYSPELEKLKGQKNIFFAEHPYAEGILEAIGHYRFVQTAKADAS